jgi:osmotically-inducible protein OsmY
MVGYHDSDLDDQVRAILRQNKELSRLRINVKVKNGIVYLAGTVNPSAREQVINLVKGLKSVAAVVDQFSTVQVP